MDEDRSFPKNHDSLQIYRARVYDKPNPGDDRLQVRIIPHMIDLVEEDTLPKYPPFFQGQVIVAKTEKTDKEAAEYVWVAALPDFTVGFILGLANPYETDSTKYSRSYNYKDTIQGLIRRGLVDSTTTYKDLLVQYWNENYLEMVNIRTGEKFFIQGNGTMIAMTKSQIYMRVGAENADNSSFSHIRMSRKEINLVTDTFRVKANNIKLGDKGYYLAGMTSVIPVSAEGVTFHPQLRIQI